MNQEYLIYPKQFRTAKIPIQRKSCFFLMPFNEQFNTVYTNIKDLLMDEGFICTRADEIAGSNPIMGEIIENILHAQYIIADLTNCNPNVFYELGIAHTFKDSQNVLLLKQKDTMVPFDISHLRYEEYDPLNLRQLLETIKKFIDRTQYRNDFFDALAAHGIVSVLNDNADAFLEYVLQSVDRDIPVLTMILSSNINGLQYTVVEDVLNHYQSMIHTSILKSQKDLLPGILRLYAILLACCSSYSVAEKYVNSFLNDFFLQDDLSQSEILEHKTDLIVALVEKEKFLNIGLPWIIQYFSRSKSTTVDLNRYKLESFLLQTSNKKIDQAMIDALRAEDCHIREHLSDIIGEKRLVSATEQLCRQLVEEENYYTAVSMIEALGKIGGRDEIDFILRWLNNHKEDIINRKEFFVLRHIQNVLAKLDSTRDRKEWNNFMSSYKQYITQDVPL